MPYATASNLIQQFSAEEIAQRSDRGTPRLVDAKLLELAVAGGDISNYLAEEQAAAAAALALINAKLLDAESIVNGYLEARYAVPLATIPRLIMVYTCDIARYQLYDDMATEIIIDRYKMAIKMLESISKGTVNLGVDVNANPAAPIGSVKSVGNDRVFNAGTLADY